MKKYLVEDVKVGVSNGGMACGPVAGYVVAELRLRDPKSKEVEYHSLAEVEGTLCFVKMEESTYDIQIQGIDESNAWDEIEANIQKSYSDYYEFYSALDNHEVSEKLAPVWKLLAYLVRADWDEIDRMKEACIGRCIGDFEIPVCDVEEKYLEDRGEEGAESEEGN